MKFAFITRHSITLEQYALAEDKGIELFSIGDIDAFTIKASEIYAKGEFEGVIIVHPAAAIRLSSDFIIGVFENGTRAKEGEKPTFEAIKLHLYNLK